MVTSGVAANISPPNFTVNGLADEVSKAEKENKLFFSSLS